MRLIRHSFEYITVIDNEVYTANFVITPTKYNRIMQKCGRMEIPYTAEELQKILGMVFKYAITVIDTVEAQKREQNIDKQEVG